jgi:DNA polymerase I-like protein with 3'-5' exonuclease and polymerase domains
MRAKTEQAVITDPIEGVAVLRTDNEISFDIETTGLSPWKSNIALMQFYGNRTQKPVLIRVFDGVVPGAVKDLFNEGGRTFVGHNAMQFDVLFLAAQDVNWRANKWYDTLIGEGVISTTSRRDVSRNLKNSVRRRLGLDIDKDIAHGGWTAEHLTNEQLVYAMNDVLYLLELKDEQIDKATQQGQYEALQMEMDLAPIVSRMTINGLPLPEDRLNEWLAEQLPLEAAAKEYLHTCLGRINLNSPKQLLPALQRAGLEVKDTRKETMFEIAHYGEGEPAEIAQQILNYREPVQRLKMYSPEWQAKHIVDGWVHPRFWQVGTDTMRFSSSDPNLQQVPRNGRKIIGGVDGLSIVSVDFSQIEVRIAAEIANDPVMKELLELDDVHRGVASQIYDVPENEITKEMRRNAKAVVFTLLFGGGWMALYQHSRNNGSDITPAEAQQLFSAFFSKFDGLRSIRAKAFDLSRNRRVVSIRLPNGGKRTLIGVMASPQRILNTAIQGGAAIGMKYAIMEAAAAAGSYMGATVHDEIVAAVPDKHAAEIAREIGDAMVRGMHRAFPDMTTKVEAKIGYTWQ